MGLRERFPETSWTLLARASKDSDDGTRAREEFAQRYYRPVRDFLVVLVRDPEQAQELAQEFFIRLSGTGGLLVRVQPEKGGFRDYLQQALRHLATDYYRRRRKEALQAHPDQSSAGAWDIMDLQGFPAAEAAFHRAWVRVTLAEALTRVSALCLKRKQEVHLHLFEARYLSEADPAPSWEELGVRYGMDQKTARDRADTVVRHFRLVLRRMLRNEIALPSGSGGQRVTEAAIDHEIKALLSPLQD
jgi:RNA polymerase sigma factor (sigma-70 family)